MKLTPRFTPHEVGIVNDGRRGRVPTGEYSLGSLECTGNIYKIIKKLYLPKHGIQLLVSTQR